MDLIPGLGRSPGGGDGNPLQYSFQENSMDRGAWWATVHRTAKRTEATWCIRQFTRHLWLPLPPKAFSGSRKISNNILQLSWYKERRQTKCDRSHNIVFRKKRALGRADI